MDMIALPKILNSKRVKDTVPNFLKNREPPLVSFTYTKTISGKIFNHNKTVEELNVDLGTENISCNCSCSEYLYEPAGHVVTGDLTIIRDAKLRSLINQHIESKIILIGLGTNEYV